jgi:hypothetical protein
MFCWHKWSCWEDKESWDVITRPFPYTNYALKSTSGIAISQERHCQKCNKKELRRVYDS